MYIHVCTEIRYHYTFSFAWELLLLYIINTGIALLFSCACLLDSGSDSSGLPDTPWCPIYNTKSRWVTRVHIPYKDNNKFIIYIIMIIIIYNKNDNIIRYVVEQVGNKHFVFELILLPIACTTNRKPFMTEIKAC